MITKEEKLWFDKQQLKYKLFADGKVKKSRMNKDMLHDLERYDELYDELKYLKERIINNYCPYRPKQRNNDNPNNKSCKQQTDEFVNLVLKNFYATRSK